MNASRPDSLYTDTWPASWYVLTDARSLKRGQRRAVDALGQAFVVWRDTHGRAHAHDRFCPHMGASLANGRVDGDRLVCPFHAWSFDAAGQCVDVPYLPADKIPARARLRAHEVREHVGLVWVWHGPEGPTHELPELPEYGHPAFGLRSKVQDFEMHPLLLLENGCDAQHFKVVHKVDFRRYDVEMTHDEPHAFGFRVHQEMAGPFGRSFQLTTGIRYVGASVIFGELLDRGKLLARFVAAPTPVAARHTRFTLSVIPKRLPGLLWPLDPLYLSFFSRKLFAGSVDDYGPIWKDMDPERRGVLVADDALQQRFRAYYKRHLPD